MNIEEIKRKWPNITSEELFPLFPQIPMSDYPELGEYTREQIYDGAMAPGSVFLASDMARKMELKEGMRVLDLGPGNCASSRFLAKHYGVRVVAAELWIDPSKNWERIERAGLQSLVMPIKTDVRDMPFAHGYFDAAFCIDAFAYFMTDDLYLSYLSKFITPRGRLCIGGHCYAEELTPQTPKEFLWDISNAYHSPSWWKSHFERSGVFNVLSCAEHPKGRELGLDDVRRNIENHNPKDMSDFQRDDTLQSIIMLSSDTERFITHFMLLAEKREGI